MAFILDTALDALLTAVRGSATHLSITSSEITAWASLAAAELGKAALTMGANGDRTGGGRKFTVPASSGNNASASGTATHWCLHNNSSTVYASGALSGGGGAVTSGNPFTTAAFDIGVPDAA